MCSGHSKVLRREQLALKATIAEQKKERKADGKAQNAKGKKTGPRQNMKRPAAAASGISMDELDGQAGEAGNGKSGRGRGRGRGQKPAPEKLFADIPQPIPEPIPEPEQEDMSEKPVTKKSFARRFMPSGGVPQARWMAVKTAFEKKILGHVVAPSKHEDIGDACCPSFCAVKYCIG